MRAIYLTEQQARTKWCPLTRIARDETPSWKEATGPIIVGGVNRDALGGTNAMNRSTHCIAGSCMDWRRFDDSIIGVGYCGAFGRP